MYCRRCNAEIPEDAAFCQACGQRVRESPAAGTDAELEHLAAQGDREAFAELYNRHSQRVYDFLLRLVRDPDEAADLMQETFLRAMRALSTEEKEAAFSTWLFTIARNLALKRLQRQKRTVGLVEGEEVGPAYQQIDPDRLADPQAASEAREMAGLVWEAAAALEPKQYSLLDLHVRQGMDSREIAQVLGVSKGNAYTMMSRLRDSFESAVGSLFLLRMGRRDCPELDRLLMERSVTGLSPAASKLIERHTAECEACRERRRKLVSPANILGAIAPMPLPLVIKQRVAEAAMASWAQAGSQAAAAGVKGWLAQPVAKVASLSTAWKAAVVGVLVLVAAGGGVGGWAIVGGGLSGSGGGKQHVAAPAATVAPHMDATPTGTAAVPTRPSGVRIAFRSDRNPKGTYVMDADGASVVYIGGQNSYETNESGWSPDGSKLAFHKCPESPGGAATFYVANADGSGQIELAQRTAPCGTELVPKGLSWSPDGKRIVFHSWLDQSGLRIVNADGTGLRYLTDGGYPQWSPTGDSIVFWRRVGVTWQCEVLAIKPDGTDERLIAEVPCEGDADFLYGPRPQWSPDGSMLAFSANSEEPSSANQMPQREIFVMKADGSGLANVSPNPGDDRDPVWVDCRVPTAGCEARVTDVGSEGLNIREGPGISQEVVGRLAAGDTACLLGSPLFKDGYKWWFVRGSDAADGWAAAFDPKRPAAPWIAATGQPCGGGVTREATPTQSTLPGVTVTQKAPPILLPGRIAFASGRGGEISGDSSVYVMNADGSVNDTGIDGEHPSWSPDGSRIVFSAENLFIMNADGSGVTQLTNSGYRLIEPEWSPDGSRIAFVQYQASYISLICTIRLDGTEYVCLEPPGPCRDPSWSPDGTRIAFDWLQDDNDDIYVMSVDGSDLVRLTYGPEKDVSPAWSPDGSRIAFVSNRDGDSKVYVMSADGSNPTLLTTEPRWQSTPAWSPDGMHVVFVGQNDDGNAEIYLVGLDGSGLTNLTNDPAWDREPAWSP